jgi:hypothetical protein
MLLDSVAQAMTWKFLVLQSALRSNSHAIEVDSQIATRIGRVNRDG